MMFECMLLLAHDKFYPNIILKSAETYVYVLYCYLLFGSSTFKVSIKSGWKYLCQPIIYFIEIISCGVH